MGPLLVVPIEQMIIPAVAPIHGLEISFTKYMPNTLLWAFISLGSAHYDLWPIILSHVHAHEAADLIIQAELSVYTPLSLGV